MEYTAFSPRQQQAMLWWNRPKTQALDGVICDGAVRSGKTLAMTLGFVLWSMSRFQGTSFAMCGRTIGSLRRNVVTPMKRWLEGLFTLEEHRTDNYITLTCGRVSNVYYLFGGHNEESAQHIQGLTLAGALLDEVVLMPRSFVEQTVARCSVTGSRLFFSCNPDTPSHWFYEEWIQRAGEKRMLYLHFQLSDNYALAPDIRERYERLYTGAFYRRYVLGEWCAAQGLVYPIAPEAVTCEALPPGPLEYYISVDYGTRNPCAMGLWAVSVVTGEALLLREYYHDSRRTGVQKTDAQYYDQLVALAGEETIERVVVDPSALSFLTTIRQAGRFSCVKANNQVLNGIRTVGEYLRSGQIKIHPRCTGLLRELGQYRWAEEGEDRPIKEADHAMDAMRYLVMTVLVRR